MQQTGSSTIFTIQWAVLGALSKRNSSPASLSAISPEYLVVGRQNLAGFAAGACGGEGDRRARIVRLTADGRQFGPICWSKLTPSVIRRLQACCRWSELHWRAITSMIFAELLNAVKLPGVMTKPDGAMAGVRHGFGAARDRCRRRDGAFSWNSRPALRHRLPIVREIYAFLASGSGPILAPELVG